MSYVDGFVMPVRVADREAFLAHARAVDAFFLDHGALRVLECWGEELPEGKQTDFLKAVAAKDNETAVLGWIEWPDKQTRDAAMAAMESDPRMNGAQTPMPFDGTRMIYGGFQPIFEVRAATDSQAPSCEHGGA